MKSFMKSLVATFTLYMITVPASAIAVEQSAHERIESATVEVIRLIEEAKTYADKNPERFYKEVDTVMAQYIDFSSFARSVMGKYGSGRYLKSLSPAEQKIHRARVARFEVLLKDRMIKTYAQGLLTFGGNKIEVVPPKGEIDDDDSVNVLQLVHNDGPYPHKLIYKMKQDSNGKWWVRNVTIGSISMGLTFRGQFADALKANTNDLDKAIDTFRA